MTKSVLTLIALLIFGLSKASYTQDNIESLLGVIVWDESVTPPVVVHTDSLTVSTANNFVDLGENAVSLPINNPRVSTMRWSASEGADSLFYVVFPPNPFNNVLDIGSIPTSVGMSPPINIKSFVLFRVTANGSTKTDSVRLSLEINGTPIFEDSVFIFVMTSLSNAIPRTVPLIQARQRVTIGYFSQDFCANINPAFRDPRNLHTMTFVDGNFACRTTFLNTPREINFLAFIAKLPEEMPVAVREQKPTVPVQFILLQNYPNPFNPETVIRFDLSQAAPVVIKIYNMLGEPIRTLAKATYPAGTHRLLWNGKDEDGHLVASGVYFYQLEAGEFSDVKKMILNR